MQRCSLHIHITLGNTRSVHWIYNIIWTMLTIRWKGGSIILGKSPQLNFRLGSLTIYMNSIRYTCDHRKYHDLKWPIIEYLIKIIQGLSEFNIEFIQKFSIEPVHVRRNMHLKCAKFLYLAAATYITNMVNPFSAECIVSTLQWLWSVHCSLT